MANEVTNIETRATRLAEKIEVLVTEARQKVASVANTAQVYTYYEIGRYIIEDEQGGKVRAEYGKGVLKRVSERLTERLGKGWSVDTLENARNFYNIYAKSEPVVRKSDVPIGKSEPVARILETSENRNQWSLNQRFALPWSHYQILTHVKDSDARSFYEIEAFKQQWSKRQHDRYVKEDFEKPTIGILLCERKNDALVELTLPKDANIYAQQYALCLPDKALLQQKLREWIAEFKEKEDEA